MDCLDIRLIDSCSRDPVNKGAKLSKFFHGFRRQKVTKWIKRCMDGQNQEENIFDLFKDYGSNSVSVELFQ